MGVTIGKTGVVKCTPVSGFDNVSIINNAFVSGYSSLSNWENGHWWGNSSDSNYKRTTITFPAGTYLILVKDGANIDYGGTLNPIVFIKYDASTNKGIYASSSDYVATKVTKKFTVSFDFRIYLQVNITNDILKSILDNTVLFRVDTQSGGTIIAKDFMEL